MYSAVIRSDQIQAAMRSNPSNSNEVEMVSKQSLTNESSTSVTLNANAKTTAESSNEGTKNSTTHSNEQKGNNSTSNPVCVLCWTEEKRLACIPCGHLATCVPCGHSLRSCPICRRQIEAFVRIYV
jgi:hypothetical protein